MWRVVAERDIEPEPQRHTYRAVLLTIERDNVKRELRVEYAGPYERDAGLHDEISAREPQLASLRRDSPPDCLIVAGDGRTVTECQ
jgi:hypothetical protein